MMRNLNYLDYSQRYSFEEQNAITYAPANNGNIGRLEFDATPQNIVDTNTLISTTIGEFIVEEIIDDKTFGVELHEPQKANRYEGIINFKYNKFTLSDSIFKNQPFDICGDGYCYKDLLMDNSGSFELPLGIYIGNFVIGRGYVSIIKTNNLGGMIDAVNTQIMKKNIIKAFFRLHNSFGGKFGTDTDHLIDIVYKGNQYYRELKGIPYSIEDNDVQINYSDRWENNKYYYILQDRPLPFNVNSITLTEEQQ
jgi:hypothetical protein